MSSDQEMWFYEIADGQKADSDDSQYKSRYFCDPPYVGTYYTVSYGRDWKELKITVSENTTGITRRLWIHWSGPANYDGNDTIEVIQNPLVYATYFCLYTGNHNSSLDAPGAM